MNDLISRQAAIDALDVLCQEHRYKIPGKGETYSQYNEAWQDALDRAEGAMFNLPSAQPQPEPEDWEWCHDCKEYDHELHCCHRWNKVIKETVEELKQAQPEIIHCRECQHWKQGELVDKCGLLDCYADADCYCYWAVPERRQE